MEPGLAEINAHLEFLGAETYDDLEQVKDDLEQMERKKQKSWKYTFTTGLATLGSPLYTAPAVEHFYSYQQLAQDVGTSTPTLKLGVLASGVALGFGLMYAGAKKWVKQKNIEEFLEAYEEDSLEDQLTGKQSFYLAKYLE